MTDTSVVERPVGTEVPHVPYSIAVELYKGLGAESKEVIECEKQHRAHRWSLMIVEPDEQTFEGFMATEISICARCYVRRCDAPVDMLKPESVCTKPINHPASPHRDARGYWREVGSG